MEKRYNVGFFTVLTVSFVLIGGAGARNEPLSLHPETPRSAKTVNRAGEMGSEKSPAHHPAQVIPDDPPSGGIDTPVEGSTVSGSIRVSGWAVDENYGVFVKIYRKSATSLVYIGDAFEHRGLRPDLQMTYPEPRYYAVGWEYELLTNFLPNQGNGTCTLVIVATDAAGHQITLGERSFTCDNANAVEPFGAIDTPSQGGDASGDSYIIWGWALTAQPNTIPTDGSTIDVIVDSVNLGHPIYNTNRPDVAALFPGYNNSDGAAGYFRLNTTVYEDGLHTLWWTVTDDAQNQATIGSRIFYVQNGPRIDVRGNGNTIAGGDTLPSGTDDTYFGTIDTDGITHTHTFEIRNTGNSDLNLTGAPVVSVEGAEFSIDVQPQAVVPSGANVSFDIVFDPASAGWKYTEVRVESDDADQSPYIFHVGGYGQTPQDSLNLVALYDSTDGANWTNNTGWLTGPVSTWFGITVSDDRVTWIDLRENNLNGTLPDEIGNLTAVTHLYLMENQLSGTIPAAIGNMSSLRRLHLDSNQLTGTIPAEIGNITTLSGLQLGDNQLDGTIPAVIWDLVNLEYLSLYENQFTGSIPPQIGNLINLTNLAISSNRFEGTIPPEIGDLTDLWSIDLFANQFSGAIPDQIVNLTNLQRLNIFNNQFSDMPDLSSMPTLQYIQIQNNRFTFEDIEPNIGFTNFIYSPQDSIGEEQDTTVQTGKTLALTVDVGGANNLYQWMKDAAQIPGANADAYTITQIEMPDAGVYSCEITNTIVPDLTLYSRPINVSVEMSGIRRDSLALVALYDSTDGANWTDNTGWLTGPVSDWFGIIVENQRVTEIYLYRNNLTGVIPAEIGDLDSLERLELWNNTLTDTIPLEIYDLSNLSWLRLTSNQLQGPIPDEIGNLSSLIYLDLSYNEHTGSIPISLTNLENLSHLDLSANELSGSIPAEIGNLSNLALFLLSYNEFTGVIPQEIWNLTDLMWLSLDGNQFSGSIPPEIGNLTNLTFLSLADNQLTGSIPAEIGNLTKLEYLELYRNQLEGAIPPEIGNLAKLIHLGIDRNRLTGIVPIEITNLTLLSTFQLFSNMLTDMPDVSGLDSLTNLRIQDNRFTFEDIEPNIGITGFIYSPQDSVGEEQSTTLSEGESLTLSVDVGGTANQYQWMKDEVDLTGAENTDLNFPSVSLSDAGMYICKITNTIAPDLTLYSRPAVLVVQGTDVADEAGMIPERFGLYQNYPNPFNPVTSIAYDLPKTSRVLLDIYDLQGRRVIRLVDGIKKAGRYSEQWNATDESGRLVPSGIYIYRIQAGEFQQSLKLVLSK